MFAPILLPDVIAQSHSQSEEEGEEDVFGSWIMFSDVLLSRLRVLSHDDDGHSSVLSFAE